MEQCAAPVTPTDWPPRSRPLSKRAAPVTPTDWPHHACIHVVCMYANNVCTQFVHAHAYTLPIERAPPVFWRGSWRGRQSLHRSHAMHACHVTCMHACHAPCMHTCCMYVCLLYGYRSRVPLCAAQPAAVFRAAVAVPLCMYS